MKFFHYVRFKIFPPLNDCWLKRMDILFNINTRHNNLLLDLYQMLSEKAVIIETRYDSAFPGSINISC